MAAHLVFIRQRAVEGQREAVVSLWRHKMQPLIARDPGFLDYHYGLDDLDPETICLMQRFKDATAARRLLGNETFIAYVEAIRPLLTGSPDIWTATEVWSKG